MKSPGLFGGRISCLLERKLLLIHEHAAINDVDVFKKFDQITSTSFIAASTSILADNIFYHQTKYNTHFF